MAKPSSLPAFTITGEDSEFSNRAVDIFGNLEAIEKKHFAKERAKEKFGRDSPSKYVNDDPAEDPVAPLSADKKPNRGGLDSTSGQKLGAVRSPEHDAGRKSPDSEALKKPGNFKVPRVPKRVKVPDYYVHPDKWTCYSLGGISDVTDRSNSAAAFQFMQENRINRENARNVETSLRTGSGTTPLAGSTESDGTPMTSHIVFKKKTAGLKAAEPDGEPKPRLTAGKVIMPEYVVGSQPKKKKGRKIVGEQSKVERKIDLNYLDDMMASSDDEDPSDLSDLSDEEGKEDEEKMSEQKNLSEANQMSVSSDGDNEAGQSETLDIFKSRKGIAKKKNLRKRKTEESELL